jgi:hypothetical protein
LRRTRGLKVRLAAAAGPLLVRALGCTLRVRIVNPEVEERARRVCGRVIYAFWHGGLLLPAYTHRGRGIGVLVSQHGDGEIIARVVERLGFRPIRGSTTRGGVAGLLGLMDHDRKCDLAITPDGPRGPRGVVQPGVAFLSRELGAPVLPSGIAAHPAWRARSWDRFAVPRPFARVAYAFEEAVEVPREGSEEDLRDRARLIERRIHQAQAMAQAALGLPPEVGA